MSEHEPHCPFLNRADYRCSNHFSLDKLDRAFTHCFGEYQTCPTYREMLGKRQSRRLETPGLTGSVVYANLTIRTRPAHVTVTAPLPRSSPIKQAVAA